MKFKILESVGVPLICYDIVTGDRIESNERLLELYDIVEYLINNDGSLNVFESVQLFAGNLFYLPFEFYYVKGNFDCSDNNLTSLKGAPKFVEGGFQCSANNLTSLKGGPIYVNTGYYCNDNNLTNLEGSPSYVGGEKICYNNNNLKDIRNFFEKGYWY